MPYLRFPEDQIGTIAQRYSGLKLDQEIVDLIAKVRQQGCLRLDQLKTVAHWKSPRSAGYVRANQSDFVREITGFALHTKNERSRIEVLTVLDGVSWPTASVILHFFHIKPYPILDFRAIWSVGMVSPSQYTFEFWWSYVQFCRDLAHRTHVDIRTLDQALWQYSKENQ